MPREQTLVVMFTDLVGFTALFKKYEVKKMAQVLQHYFNDMDIIIHRHNGWIHKFNGDGMIVLFGVKEHKERCAQDALTAGLEMQQRMQEFLTPTYNVEMRIGMEIGPVVVDEIVTEHARRYDLLGEVVNLASRLEPQSRAGGMLLGPKLYQMLEADIDCATTSDRLEIKGLKDFVPVCHVDPRQPKKK